MASKEVSKTRSVTIYSTVGQSGKIINTDALTWGQLQGILNSEGVTYNGMKAVIGETQLTLESNEATLPSTDWVLFLMPKKTKSGLSNTRIAVQQIIANAKDNTKAKAHFNKDKNYTQKDEASLTKLVSKWIEKNPADKKYYKPAPATPVSVKKVATKAPSKPVAKKVVTPAKAPIAKTESPKVDNQKLRDQASRIAQNFSDVKGY